ncbi:MAG TPA: PDC sensor domain-containing protein [Gammaproteobacteria bacterium]|jgi:hypothetical protein
MSWKIVPVLAAALFSTAMPTATFADNNISQSLKNKIRMVQHMALNPLLIKAVRQQNFEALDMEIVHAREQEWKTAGESEDLKKSMLEGEHAALMQRFMDENRGLLEICLTDSLGANVAAYPLTDDYWQGDEEEWIKAFNDGKGQVFIGSLERDEKTNSMFTHVSAPVFDRNKTIGVLVVAVRLGGIE